MAKCAVIFDVDGILLELTPPEEDLFFQAFAKHTDPATLSRDWNSYEIRNDEDIVAEILNRLGLPQSRAETIKLNYLNLLENNLKTGKLKSDIIYGAKNLLDEFAAIAHVGIATANFRKAAELRLSNASLWNYVKHHAQGADGGGHKHEILKRTLANINLPPDRIVYIGDNVNDVEAGRVNGVKFIGFSQSPKRLELLKAAGATHLSYDHTTTRQLIKMLLNL